MQFQNLARNSNNAIFLMLSLTLNSCAFASPTKNFVGSGSGPSIGEIREISPGPYGSIYFDVNQSIKSEFAKTLEATEFVVRTNEQLHENATEFNERSWLSKAFNPTLHTTRHRAYKIAKGEVLYAASNENNVLRYCTENNVGVIQETGQPVPYCSFNVDKANGKLIDNRAPDIKVVFYEMPAVGKGYRDQYYLQSIVGSRITILHQYYDYSKNIEAPKKQETLEYNVTSIPMTIPLGKVKLQILELSPNKMRYSILK